MKLQSVKRIIKESLPSQYHDLVGVVGYSFNTFAEDVINAFNKKITVDDNLNMEYKTIEVNVNATGVPVNTTQFRTVVVNTRGVIIIRCEDLSATPAAPDGAPFMTYSINNNILTVSAVTGLKPNRNYRLTVLVLG